jgi:hypothetical protein
MDRPLTTDEDAALRWILYVEDVPGVEELRSQVPHVRAVYGLVTQLDLVVDDGQPATIADGHYPVTALVVGEKGEPIGHIDLWIKDGWLGGIEYSWFTEEMPVEYPAPHQLALDDPVRLGRSSLRGAIADRAVGEVMILAARGICAIHRRRRSK